MSTQQEIQEILEDFYCGISLSHWAVFQKCYQQRFNKSLDYKSLGVTDGTQLLKVMREKVVFFKMHNKNYVMSARVAKLRRERLKLNVEKILYMKGGKIKFDSFEDCYKLQFTHNLFYGYYGLTDLDHLCRIFKNNLVVEEEGKKMIKAVKGMYNLRTRKK